MLAIALICLVACALVYVYVPQIIIQHRMDGADVLINDCIIQLGTDSAELATVLTFTIPQSVVQVPLIDFTATTSGFTAVLSTRVLDASQDFTSDEELGTLTLERGLSLDSHEDAVININSSVKITSPRTVAKVVDTFIKEPNITMTVRATVDIQVKAWGWLPIPFFGVSVGKSLTLPAMNNFRKHPVAIKDFTAAHGAPGELNISGIASLYNPCPVTVVLTSNVSMQIYFTYLEEEYRIGVLDISVPLIIKPGENLPSGTGRLYNKNSGTNSAIQAAFIDYMGPQHGFGPTGSGGSNLPVRLGDGYSESPLIRRATQFLSVNVNIRPKPIYFLSAITADVTGFASIVPPFYEVVVHIQVKNPIPAVVYLTKVTLVAHHLNLEGPVLYNLKRVLDRAHYTLSPNEERTLDFKLSPMREVSWGFLFNPDEILDLIHEASVQEITVGIKLDLELRIQDDYDQVVPYQNSGLTGLFCFHLTAPETPCGGLPPTPPPRPAFPRPPLV